MLTLYKNIKKLRLANGWTQAELAKRAGYSDRSMISRIESGNVDISERQIMKFAEIFGVKAGDLMGNDGCAEDDVQKSVTPVYYTNPETAKKAQEMFEDPTMRVLFDMKRNMDPDKFQAHVDMMKRLYQLEHPEMTDDTGA